MKQVWQNLDEGLVGVMRLCGCIIRSSLFLCVSGDIHWKNI